MILQGFWEGITERPRTGGLEEKEERGRGPLRETKIKVEIVW